MKEEREYLETSYGVFSNNPSIGKTAQEVYQEWLEGKDKQIDICTQETDQQKISRLESEIEELSDMIIMMSQQ